MSPVAIILLSIAGMFLYNCIKYRKKDNTEKTDAISCSFSTQGSYSSILNHLESDVYLLAKNTHGYGKIGVVVSVQKTDSMYCCVSGSFLADIGFNGVSFDNGYEFNGSDFVSFKAEYATGFTTTEDVKREMLTQFHWHDLEIYDAKFTVIEHGDFTNAPFISYSFSVKEWKDW